jgi:hypothetical protein
MNRPTLALTGLLAVLSLVAACGSAQPDVDDARPKALRISPGVLVKDSIDARKDPVDWKDFSYFQDARATVVFSFGDRFEPHEVQGEIGLYDFDGNALQSRQVVPGTVDYKFSFDARKDKDYFFRLDVRKGRAAYLVETRVEPLDPCSACEGGAACCPPVGCCAAGQSCRNGACVAATCSPRCGRGEVCVEGQCEEACPGGCRKGKVCDEDSRRCVSAEPSMPRPAPAARKCPPCGTDQSCNESTGQCEGGGAGIAGTVLSVTEEGSGVVILINRGSEDGVKRGASGRVAGLSFTVREVTATKCKALLAAKPAQVPPKSRVTIDR